ncbi:hypothetical protein C0995_000624, partial [Termitomyces sp. Mi166
MDFATRNAIVAPDSFLHFQLPTSDGNLIIRAKVGTNFFELVPDVVFCQTMGPDFPSSFITEYAHWLHLSPASNIGCVTSHPLHSVWQPSDDNWDLTFDPAIGTATMKTRNGLTMVDIRSKTFGMISKRLHSLDVPSHVHITLDPNGTLSAKLLRYKLAFFVNENKDLECSTIRDMVVDLNQS